MSTSSVCTVNNFQGSLSRCMQLLHQISMRPLYLTLICADKCAMCTAHDIIGSFCWDHNHLGGQGVSPPFLSGSWQLLGTSSVVSCQDDMSLTSKGVIDEAITCFGSLLKGVLLPAPHQYTLLNHWVRTLQAKHAITKDRRGKMYFNLRCPNQQAHAQAKSLALNGIFFVCSEPSTNGPASVPPSYRDSESPDSS